MTDLKVEVRKRATSIIVAVVIWVIVAVLLIAPVTYSYILYKSGQGDITTLFVDNIKGFDAMMKLNSVNGMGTFGKFLGMFTVIYAIIIMIGFVKNGKNRQYSTIEYGSSDWSTNGEEYRILSKNSGIRLSTKHFLPVDKRGNLNVLIVRRFRNW